MSNIVHHRADYDNDGVSIKPRIIDYSEYFYGNERAFDAIRNVTAITP